MTYTTSTTNIGLAVLVVVVVLVVLWRSRSYRTPRESLTQRRGQ